MNIYMPEIEEIEVLTMDSGRIMLRSGASSIVLTDSGNKKRVITYVDPGDAVVDWHFDMTERTS